MGINYGSRIVTEKLVFHVDAANTKSYPGSGNTLYDLSRNNYTGTFGGLTVPTVSGGHMSFNGNNSVTYAESIISKDPSGSLNLQSGQISVETWVRRTGTQTVTNPRILSTDGSDYWALNGNGSGSSTVRFYINPNATNTFLLSNSTIFQLDQWFHIVATYDKTVTSGTNTFIYIDGVLDASSTVTTAGNWGDGTSRAFGIGSNVESSVQNSSGWNGQIDIARLYGKALTAGEVKQNFEAHRGRFGI
jgi:hypothetical protein